ncbi:MAG: signal recognition particle protein [Gammaproteobacteria bacterium]|jgi:signal recognition particle subunit SRP54|nr:signal recognition particle protein [Gammaproteobacteria bacterium]
MFENLSERLAGTVKHLKGQARLTEDNIRDSLREVRMALLEADVALPVVRSFIDEVRERARGQDVLHSLTPGQALIKIVNDELVRVMGEANEGLNLQTRPPAVVMLAGLQGAGKTTTAGKLARWLRENAGKQVMVASCDVYRPAAIQQLERLAGEVGAAFYPSEHGQDPVEIARAAVESARSRASDVLILDTAGRLHIDAAMMDEVARIHSAVEPVETLFVVDSMTGQDAANSARAFNDALPLTGVILTKTDGDARGGAALSVRHVTGKPVKFIGVGEKSVALEPFHPDRIASRILGMGDVLGLVEAAQRKVDQRETEKLARKLKSGKGFGLEDLKTQLEQMLSMGGVAGLLDKLPGATSLPASVRNQADDGEIRRMIAIVDSMTRRERRFPEIVKGSRKRRIASGSGTRVQDVNRLLKQHTQMRKMMKRFSKGGMNRMMRGMKGGMPPGMPFG